MKLITATLSLLLLASCSPAQSAKKNSKSTLPVGTYRCYTSGNMKTGWIYVLDGSHYKILKSGTVGEFKVNPADHSVDWVSGTYKRYDYLGWYLAPGETNNLRGENNKNRWTIYLIDRSEHSTPYDAKPRDSKFLRCFLGED